MDTQEQRRRLSASRRQAVSDSVSAERARREIRLDARRRADILESGTPEELAALRAEYEEERQARLLRVATERLDAELDQIDERARDDFYLALELETGRKWSPGDPPPSVVYTRRELWCLLPADQEKWG